MFGLETLSFLSIIIAEFSAYIIEKFTEFKFIQKTKTNLNFSNAFMN